MFQQPKHISQLITEVVVYYHRVELLTQQQRVASNLCMRPNPDNLYQLTKIETASKCSKPPRVPPLSPCVILPPPGPTLLSWAHYPRRKIPPGLFSPHKSINFSRYPPPPPMLCLFYLSTFFLPIYASLTILSFFLHPPPPSLYSISVVF